MGTFQLYLELGYKHILDISAYDHLMFIITLCGVYMLRQWRQVLMLVTAFTIGHSVSLALAVLDIISAPTQTIEFLIAFTIFISSVFNLISPSGINSTGRKLKYGFALIFGLIHGLGFSNYLKSMLADDGIGFPLFSFNIGLEIGQIIIVAIILIITASLNSFLRVAQRDINMIISGAGIGIATIMMLERW